VRPNVSTESVYGRTDCTPLSGGVCVTPSPPVSAIPFAGRDATVTVVQFVRSLLPLHLTGRLFSDVRRTTRAKNLAHTGCGLPKHRLAYAVNVTCHVCADLKGHGLVHRIELLPTVTAACN
jgi:hypothetical protein